MRSVLAIATMALVASPATAQLGRSHPGPNYFSALDELYAGEFRRATRGMQNELRTAVRTVDSRWVDSIIYHAGLGETLYQQGLLSDSLAQFDAAIDLFLQHAAWMRSVEWRQTPREDLAIARRTPDWARPPRPITYANVPRSVLYSFGRVNNSAAYQQGGVVQQAQFWKLDAEELARSIAWTIYRRGELLGPLGAYDPRTRALADRIAGGGLSSGNGWAEPWVELWWGLAEASRGAAVEAQPHLDQALLLGGRLDHRLASMAWLAKAQLALGAGDARAAAMFHEALSGSIAYEEIGVMIAALRGWHVCALSYPKAPQPPLANCVAWAEQQRYWLAAAQARLLLAEAAAKSGDPEPVKLAFRRGREMSQGQLGVEAQRLFAMASASVEGPDRALQRATQAIESKSLMSRRMLQVEIASLWTEDGTLSSRLAQQALGEVLADPSALSWIDTPLEGIVATSEPATKAFERWFFAVVEREDALAALAVIDQQRRREIHSAMPLGSRMTAIQWLLEASEETLPRDSFPARARLEIEAPEYRGMRQAGLLAARDLRTAFAESPGEITSAIRNATEELQQTVEDRQQVILRLAMSREWTPLVFPAPFDAVTAKSRLAQGEAMLVFHVAGDDLYGVLFAAGGEHLWRIGPIDEVRSQIEQLLRAVAGPSPRKAWTVEELEEGEWAPLAEKLGRTLLEDSRLDGKSLTRLWVVPDGPLWRAPLAIIPIPSPDNKTIRLGEVATTYAPTPGWAMRPRLPNNPAEIVWKLASDPSAEIPWEGPDPLRAISGVVTPTPGFEGSTAAVKSAADGVIFNLTGQTRGVDPLGLQLLTTKEGTAAISSWRRPPTTGAAAIALVGLGGGEAGGAKSRRSRRAKQLTGAPELHMLGALLAGGSQTILVERWNPGGVRSRELIAEWFNGLGRLDPASSWKRALQLGRPEQLETEREPRLQGGAASAEHPFWWSGYYVVD